MNQQEKDHPTVTKAANAHTAQNATGLKLPIMFVLSSR